MIRIEKVKDIYGALIDGPSIPSKQNITINNSNLTLLPALIDPHVHFRTPGHEYKEDWRAASQAAIRGGYTTVFDMPNTLPPTITQTYLKEKKTLIDAQLKEVDIPLRYHLFFGADKKHLDEIVKVKEDIIGIKVFMGCSTGNLVIDDDESLEKVFCIAAENNLLVAVHAEDEQLLQQRKHEFLDRKEYAVHSEIRSVQVACRAVKKAIALTKRYQTRLYILHVSSQEEVRLIDHAKQAGLPVYAETTPHHLFLDTAAYPLLKGKAVVNPPLRLAADRKALFSAIHAGIIDTIGSDHAPHTPAEKEQPYGECPSGMPGIETTLSLLLNAHYENLLSLEEIISLTSKRAREIFNLEKTNDMVLVDLKKEIKISDKDLKTKCGWSPYAGMVLHGCPVYTIFNNYCYQTN
ncbi:MAG: allB [Gammaproteobacteria bacterium]|jgi:dihydroorotase|nr:allB [Gammaproteobacteria bacterium]